MFNYNEHTILMNKPDVMLENKETKLLRRAIDAFQNATGLEFEVEYDEHAINDGRRVDAIIRLHTQGVDKQFLVETKGTLNTNNLGTAVLQLQRFPKRGLLVTNYVNPKIAQRLKEMDIPFIDVAGNAYIKELPIYVYITGNKPAEFEIRKTKTRAFQPTGLKILYAFLCNPTLVNAPYRDIAHAADVALGTVGWVINDLKKLGHLVEMGKKKRRLKGLKKLFERWVETYPDQLRPKLLIGRFTTDEKVWWKNTKLQKFNAYMGGEIAAEYLTHYLIPEIKTMYVRGKPQDLQLTFKMHKDPNGEIELLETFWNAECDWIDKKIVHPVLIYADLLATSDPRNIETAQMIYEKEIAEHLRED